MKIEKVINSDKFLIGIAFVLSICIFLININIPFYLVSGIPYVLVILLAAMVVNPKWISVFALSCSVLVLLGYYFFPGEGDFWALLTNRALALVSIWTVATLCLMQKNKEQKSKVELSLVSKLNLLIVILVLLSIGTIGYRMFEKEREFFLQHAINEAQKSVRSNARDIEIAVMELTNDVKFLAKVPAIQGIIRTGRNNNVDPLDGSSGELWRSRLATIFKGLLEEKSQYFSIRYIGKADNGREIVRVDNRNGKIERVNEEYLQPKGSKQYFINILKLHRGELYISPINLNREFGKVETPHRPVLRVAIPVFDTKDDFFGMVIINMEVGSFLNSFIQLNPNYVIVNAKGDFLAHKNPELTFGFDLDKRYALQDDYPELAGQFATASRQKEISVVLSPNGEEKILYFWKTRLGTSKAHPFIWIGEIQKLSDLNQEWQPISHDNYLLVFGLILISLAAGSFFIGRLISPLKELSNATSAFAQNEAIPALVIQSNDEVGVLANSLQNMMETLEHRNRSIQANEAYIQTLLNSALDVILTVDSQCSIHMFNPAAEKLFGYLKSEVAGKNVKMLIPEPYRSEHDQYLENYLKTGESTIIGIGREVVGQRKDGITFTMELMIAEMWVEDELFFAGIGRNITERKKVEEELDRSKKELEKNTEILMQQNWLETGISELNDKIRGDQSLVSLSQNAISYLAERLDAQVGAIYIWKENLLKVVGSYAYSMPKNLSIEFRVGEGLVGQAALEKKNISISNIPEDYIKITSGLGECHPRNIIVVPLLFDNETLGVIELGSFEKFEDKKIQFLERAKENIAFSLSSALSRDRTKALLEETQIQAKTMNAQQEELRQTNEELERQSKALKESENELRSQQEELKQTNEELEKQTTELEEQKSEVEQKSNLIQEKVKELELASKYKSEFLANMSHELRTPLNSMLLLSKLLADNKIGNLTEKQVEFAQTINGAGDDLLNLINDILDLSKVESGKLELVLQNVELKDISEETRRNFQHVAANKGIGFNVELEKGLPEQITTDVQRLHQVLKNLLSNAFKFTEKGEVVVKIFRPKSETCLDLSGLDFAESVAFSVRDTGKGIAKEKQDIIFKAFQQEDGTANRKYGGTGLGLSISKELAKLLGGEIHMESVEGQGSVFTVFVPEKLQGKIVDETGVEEAEPLEVDPDWGEETRNIPEEFPVSDDRAETSVKDRSLLVIEDDPKFCEVLKDLAREKNFKFLVAGDGESGIIMAQKFKPTAVILDIGLPGIDGMMVLNKLKSNPDTREIPVHFISVSEKTHYAMKMGAIGFLQKPVTPDKLEEAFARIENVVSHGVKNLLIVEDNQMAESGLDVLSKVEKTNIIPVSTGEKAIEYLDSNPVDCMILDLNLKGMGGIAVLEHMEKNPDLASVPVIIYTEKGLSKEEGDALRKYSESIIIKGVNSTQRLLDETTLFLHRVQSDVKPERNGAANAALHEENITELKGKKVLLVDDDLRNIFALTHVLEMQQMSVIFAKNGKEALDKIEKNPDTDIVLMDIMMPVMDGYEAMQEIRNMERFKAIPILALTAKAMKGDKQKCIEAGANDYISKPIDSDNLLSQIRAWLSN